MKRAAFVLGLCGLIPFIGLGVLALASATYASAAAGMQKDYAAAVLAFLGALHWGATLIGKLPTTRAWISLAWGVVPALWAVAVTGKPITLALPWLGIGILLTLGLDWAMRRWHGWPSWYLPLRLMLTVGSILGISLTMVAIS